MALSIYLFCFRGHALCVLNVVQVVQIRFLFWRKCSRDAATKSIAAASRQEADCRSSSRARRSATGGSPQGPYEHRNAPAGSACRQPGARPMIGMPPAVHSKDALAQTSQRCTQNASPSILWEESPWGVVGARVQSCSNVPTLQCLTTPQRHLRPRAPPDQCARAGLLKRSGVLLDDLHGTFMAPLAAILCVQESRRSGHGHT